jgi:CDP-glycerol glycerophosphotransferase (TagB/SpsB family)
MEMWRRSAQHDPHLHLIEDADRDVIPFLRAADLLVTDASSVQLEYLVLDRPMVLINNPRRFGRKEFDPAGFEWAWRDMGSEAESGEAACEAIAAALADPGGRAAQRAQYRKQVLQLERFLPLIRARWITGWPLRRARDLRRRAKRFFAAVKTRAIT